MSANISQTAFEQEAMPHLQDLYRTAARLVRNRTEAEDLIQEVFLLAWKAFDKYEPGTNCRAWLYKILFFKISHYRHRFYVDAKRFQYLDEDETTINSFVYEEPVSPRLTDEEVIAALNALPENYRIVILLADVEEFSYREVAEIISVPIGTVMSRLNRARKQLRESLAPIAPQFGIRFQNAKAPANTAAACAAC